MPNRFRICLLVLSVGGFMGVGCSVDKQGISTDPGDASVTDAASDRGSSGGTGGRAGTGGTPVVGTGGQAAGVGSGGRGGTGGSVGVGTGGNVTGTGGSGLGTSGGSPGSGGSVGSGGDMGSGGFVGPGTGGDSATGTGGDIGTGGAVGTGGSGTGGRGTGGSNSSCNASTCPNGCCNGNNCITNRTDQRCGTAGAACAPCAPCFQCSNAGVCGLISNAEWDIVCVSATIAPTKPGGMPWDTTGVDANAAPDPICQLTLDGIRRTSTDTEMQTFSPMWEESISPGGTVNLTHNVLVAQPTRWSVSVVDYDAGMVLGDPVCSVSPRLTAEDFAAGLVKLPATESCTSLVIRLVCAED